jgi:hypothetical protein
MLETPHVVVGAAIATQIANPILAIPLAFTSHFLLERVPHWNPHLNTELRKYGKITPKTTLIVAVDVALSLILGFTIAARVLPDTNHAFTIIFASFAAVVPDIIEGPYFFLKMKNPFIEKWISLQKSIQNDASILPGLATQALTITAALWWIFS